MRRRAQISAQTGLPCQPRSTCFPSRAHRSLAKWVGSRYQAKECVVCSENEQTRSIGSEFKEHTIGVANGRSRNFLALRMFGSHPSTIVVCRDNVTFVDLWDCKNGRKCSQSFRSCHKHIVRLQTTGLRTIVGPIDRHRDILFWVQSRFAYWLDHHLFSFINLFRQY